jgi:alkylhydroperoxidase/carboxymuconolactone decarboxylase family protein YurZ
MAFAPAIDQFLKEHLFGATFARDILTHQQRELVTVSALAAMEGVGAQLQSHFSVAMNTGLTKNQLEGILDVVEKNISKEQADKGRVLLSNVKSK